MMDKKGNYLKTFRPAYRQEHKPSRVFFIFSLLITALFCHAIVADTASAATYYLDAVNGDDSNPGTSAEPWQTMERAMSDYSGTPRVGNGDTVYLRSGNYGSVTFDHTVSRTSWDDGVTYIAEKGETPIFTYIGLGAPSFCNRYITFDGIHVVNKVIPAPSGTALVSIKNSGHVHLKNMYMEGNGGQDTGEADWTWYGVCTKLTASGYKIRDILLENCEITKVNRAFNGGVYSDLVIRGNELHELSSSALYLCGETTKENAIILEGNHIYNQLIIGDHHGTAISIRCEPVIVRNNIIHNYGRSRCIRCGGDTVPEGGYQNMVFENNLIYDSHNVYTVDLGSIGDNLTFRNNTIISRWRWPSLDPYVRYQGALGIGLHSSYDHSTFHIHNNIIVGGASIGGTVAELATMDEDNNIIWVIGLGYTTKWAGDNTVVIVASPTEIAAGYSETYFEESCGFFAGGADFDTYSFTISAEVEPLFGASHGVELNDAYKLAEGSDAIGFADPTHAPATDILGNPRNAAPDAGCYEYVGAPILDHIGDKFVGENETLTFDVNATDPDGDTITYSVQNKPTTATFIGQTFTWTPTHSEVGEHQVKFIASDGQYQDSETITITVLKADKEFGKLTIGCYNNVFNPTKGEKALIIVNLPKQARVKLVLYNTRGNKIKELVDKEEDPGIRKYHWDGTNDSGNIVGSGLYFVHIQAGAYKKTEKIVVVK